MTKHDKSNSGQGLVDHTNPSILGCPLFFLDEFMQSFTDHDRGLRVSSWTLERICSWNIQGSQFCWQDLGLLFFAHVDFEMRLNFQDAGALVSLRLRYLTDQVLGHPPWTSDT